MATLSLSNGTYPASSLSSAQTADGDSVTVTNATVNGIYQPGGGDDLYSIIDSSVGQTNSHVILDPAAAGNDTVSATNSTLNGRLEMGGGNDSIFLSNVDSVGVIAAGFGNDTLNLNSVTLSQGTRNIDAGADNDSVSLNAVSGVTSVALGGGSNSLSMTDTTIASLVAIAGNAEDSQSISLDGSSVNSGLATGQSSLNHVILNDSTLNGALFLNNYTAPDGSSPISTIEIINGSSVSGGIAHGNSATLRDYIHIADSTISGAVSGGNQGANSEGADTILIENATFTGSGNQINLDGNGDHVTITGTQMSAANINIGGVGGAGQYNYTISVSDTTLNDMVDQAGNNASITLNNSSMNSFAVNSQPFFGVAPGPTLSASISNSTIAADSSTSGSADTVSLLNGSEFGGNRFDLSAGNDKFALGTDTKFTNNTDNMAAGWGLSGGGNTDTLELVGVGAFSLSLLPGEPAILQNDQTVTLVTNDNYDQVKSWSTVTGVTNIRGTLSLADSNSTVLVQQFESLEAVPCFVNGTMIMTDKGERPVESLRVGDLVQTADAGLQPIRWIKSKPVNALNMVMKPAFVPIRIKQGALGNGLPLRDLLVSPQHRMLVSGKLVERMFDTQQALCAAVHLLELEGIERATEQVGFDYVHFMLGDHHVVYAEGAPTETLYVGEMAMDVLGDDACKELEDIFPELCMPVSNRIMAPARLFLTGRQGRKLTERVIKNNHALLSGEYAAAEAHSIA